MKSAVKHTTALFILSFYLCFNFFVVGKYSVYPWWHQSKNDIDASIAATTVGLLNGSAIQYVYHPGVTIYFISGIVYRSAAVFDAEHKLLFHLRRVGSLYDASQLLHISTRTARIITLFLAVIFAAVFYFTLFQWTGSFLISFLFAFAAVTSQAFVMHSFMVRSEILSLMFVFLASMVYLNSFKSSVSFLRRTLSFVLIGFLIGFSVLSKIQIIPVIAFFFFFLLITLSSRQKENPAFFPASAGLFILSFVVSFINIVITPWWALRRPEFLTPEFTQSLKSYSHEYMVYGNNPPENFYFLAGVLLGVPVVAAGLGLLLFLKKSSERILRILGPSVLGLNLIVTGLIVSVYSVLLPVSVSFSQYCANTRHLVFAVLTNVLGGKMMERKVIDHENFMKIIDMHGSVSAVLNINILLSVSIAVVVALIRIFKRDEKSQKYLTVIGFCALGFAMDFLATLRGPTLYNYYACYSVCFYFAALAIWVEVELKVQWTAFSAKMDLKRFGYYLIILLLFTHAFKTSHAVLTAPRATGESTQSPLQEYQNTRAIVAPFWQMVKESIENNNR